MTTKAKEAQRARRGRRYLEDLVDSACQGLHENIEVAQFEMMRILGIAQEEHRQLPRPARYFREDGYFGRPGYKSKLGDKPGKRWRKC